MGLRSFLGILRQSLYDFVDNDCFSMAAALAYFTVFSIPPLLILALLLARLAWDPAVVEHSLQGQFAEMIGPEAARGIGIILQNVQQSGTGTASLFGFVALLFGATVAFVQLQYALNRAWEVAPSPDTNWIKDFLLKRVFSFGMILGVGFLLLVSLVVSALLSAFGVVLAQTLELPSRVTLEILDILLSLATITLLFGAIFKIVPDAVIAWRDVWVGAAFTAMLFVLGKTLIGLYLGQSHFAQAFGAASSLAILLLWIYYSSLILLFGAEFTQRWAEARGRKIRPEKGAVRSEPVYSQPEG